MQSTLKNNKKRAAIYLRVTQNEDAINWQKNIINNYLKVHHKYEVADEFVDTDNSRADFSRMMIKAIEGKYDVIVTPSIVIYGKKLTEVSKNVKKLKQLSNPVEVVFVREELNTFDPMSDFVIAMMINTAREKNKIGKIISAPRLVSSQLSQ